jgi:hypothetical protein
MLISGCQSLLCTLLHCLPAAMLPLKAAEAALHSQARALVAFGKSEVIGKLAQGLPVMLLQRQPPRSTQQTGLALVKTAC